MTPLSFLYSAPPQATDRTICAAPSGKSCITGPTPHSCLLILFGNNLNANVVAAAAAACRSSATPPPTRRTGLAARHALPPFALTAEASRIRRAALPWKQHRAAVGP